MVDVAKLHTAPNHDRYNVTYELQTAATPNILLELRDVNALAEAPSGG